MTTPLVDDGIATRWAASGLLALTGPPREPLGPPERLVPGLDALGQRFPGLDPLALMGERAAFSDLRRHGTTSCGGSCRLLPASDHWLAVSLPRSEDIELLPAWLERTDAPREAHLTPALWEWVQGVIRERPTDQLLERASLLQLPVAGLGRAPERPPVVRQDLGRAVPKPVDHHLVVVDLTALWAGPLCGDLLARSGATVIKVESTSRPDGARDGPKGFFDLLNGAKRSVALDFGQRDGLEMLRRLLHEADVVLESSRPRALEQLGIRAAELVAGGGPRVWLSITGYGRSGAAGARVAFGDDAAVAGGLVTQLNGSPMFCADALADPVAGLTAATACLSALEAGGRWLLDVSMAAAAAALAGPSVRMSGTEEVAAPRARPVITEASESGADTAAVLRDLGLVA